MKLQLAYDGSECSDRAILDLRVAGLPDDVEAVVVSVAERWLPPPSIWTLAGPGDEVVPGLERASNLAARACVRLQNLFPSWDVRAAVSKGSPASQILQDAEEWHPDLIVVGSHGETGLAHLLLGSVSEKVASTAPCSVRVARGRNVERSRPVRLLVGLDSSAEAQEAVREILRRKWPKGSAVLVYTAIDPSLEGSPQQDTELGWIDMLQRAAESELRGAGLVVERQVAEGDPRRLLPRKAKDWEADCIFVGSHEYGHLKRFLLGSVARAVAARAGCSVEVVRSHHPNQ
jgi:nucleotide-binding universal stress UspA family protein